MKRTLPALDVDLLIEHGGYQLKLIGSGVRFVARFPTLLALLHFARFYWPSRKRVPRWASVRIEWRWLSVPVKASK